MDDYDDYRWRYVAAAALVIVVLVLMGRTPDTRQAQTGWMSETAKQYAAENIQTAARILMEIPANLTPEQLERIRQAIASEKGEVPPPPGATPVPVISEGFACPVVPGPGEQLLMTQGYGVGTHAPAETWGAIDIAVAGVGGQLIVAPADGYVRITPNSWPAGNHIWLTTKDGQYQFGMSHLLSFIVENGTSVKKGDPIAYLGGTGMSSGPHLDLQVWKAVQGVTATTSVYGNGWVNVDPTSAEGGDFFNLCGLVIPQ